VIDQRVPFFLIAGVVCALLVPVADPDHRWVAAATAITYAVLALLFALDSWSRARERRRSKRLRA
jgi:uncharacterized membrane protein